VVSGPGRSGLMVEGWPPPTCRGVAGGGCGEAGGEMKGHEKRAIPQDSSTRVARLRERVAGAEAGCVAGGGRVTSYKPASSFSPRRPGFSPSFSRPRFLSAGPHKNPQILTIRDVGGCSQGPAARPAGTSPCRSFFNYFPCLPEGFLVYPSPPPTLIPRDLLF
jgi:hypothetical protein